jgi:hypothetical protein
MYLHQNLLDARCMLLREKDMTCLIPLDELSSPAELIFWSMDLDIQLESGVIRKNIRAQPNGHCSILEVTKFF